MKRKNIDLNIIKELLDNIPEDLEVSSILLTNDTYKIKVLVSSNNFDNDIYNNSLQALLNIIDSCLD